MVRHMGNMLFFLAIIQIGSSVDVLRAWVMVDSAPVDSLEKDTTFTYANVDLLIETGWSDPERIDKVTIDLQYVTNEPHAIRYSAQGGEKNEIRIFPGMSVTIFDHDSRGVLKKIVKKEVKRQPAPKTKGR